LRVHDREGAKFGFYIFDGNGTMIAPGEEYEKTYEFSDYDFDGYNISTVTLVEVQPLMREGSNLNCEAYATQDVECYSGTPF
jgi:hypothetical protein